MVGGKYPGRVGGEASRRMRAGRCPIRMREETFADRPRPSHPGRPALVCLIPRGGGPWLPFAQSRCTIEDRHGMDAPDGATAMLGAEADLWTKNTHR